MSCLMHNPRVCLGRDDVDGSCVFCVRQAARDAYRAGVISFDEFRRVLAETNEAAK